MVTVAALYNRMKAIDVKQISIDTLKETAETAADLNAEQMFKGLRADGSEITPSYSDPTIQIKEAKGQITDHVTLRDSGSFHEKTRVEVDSEKMVFKSIDEKSARLEKKYSKSNGSIFGLSLPYKREYMNERVRPTFKKNIQVATRLRMR